MNRKNVIRTLTAIAVVLLLGWSFFYFGDDTRGCRAIGLPGRVSVVARGWG